MLQVYHLCSCYYSEPHCIHTQLNLPFYSDITHVRKYICFLLHTAIEVNLKRNELDFSSNCFGSHIGFVVLAWIADPKHAAAVSVIYIFMFFYYYVTLKAFYQLLTDGKTSCLTICNCKGVPQNCCCSCCCSCLTWEYIFCFLLLFPYCNWRKAGRRPASKVH